MQKLDLVRLFEQGKNPWVGLGTGWEEGVYNNLNSEHFVRCHTDFGYDQNRTWKFYPVQSFGQFLLEP